jgi:hypothetical protein
VTAQSKSKNVDSTLDERGAVYGDPTPNHVRISRLWSVVLETEVTPAQAALCMALVKVARLVQTPDHEDSIHDLSGYAEVYRRIIEASSDTPGTPS